MKAPFPFFLKGKISVLQVYAAKGVGESATLKININSTSLMNSISLRWWVVDREEERNIIFINMIKVRANYITE